MEVDTTSHPIDFAFDWYVTLVKNANDRVTIRMDLEKMKREREYWDMNEAIRRRLFGGN